MERITRHRAGFLLAFFACIVFIFALRLYKIQILDVDPNADNTKTFTIYTQVKAPRGNILDINGNMLVTNRASYNLTLNHYVILSVDGTNDYLLSLVELCRELDIEYNDHFPLTYEAPFTYTLGEYNATWQSYFQAYLADKGMDSDMTAPLLIKKLRTRYQIPENWSDEEARAVIGLRYELALRQGITNLPVYVFLEDAHSDDLSALLELNIPGLKTEHSTVREYTTKYAAHVLGYCSAMTPEQWEHYKTVKDEDGKALYAMDALVGQTGFEAAFEEYLHGVDGLRADVVRVDGSLVRSYYVEGREPKAGKNVEVTLDLTLQRAAEDSLETFITELQATAIEGQYVDGADIEGGALVAIDVKTGAVLACASYPTYDPSTFFEDYEILVENKHAPLYNRALQAVYPPGSTYKMTMVVAGFNSGIINADTLINDKGEYKKYAPSFTANCLTYTRYGTTHGSINAVTALEKSCNYFFYELADMDEMSIQYIDNVAKYLGLGEVTGIELPEKLGYRANPTSKAALYKGDEGRWYAADQIMASIGQSINQFTPMQLCVYTSTLANQGIRYKATFLKQVISADYQERFFVNTPTVVSTLNISDATYSVLKQGMLAAGRTGTARSVFKDYPIDVAVKTGTAQHSNGKNVSDNGAFVCFAPLDNPEIAIAVYGEKAGHGYAMGRIAKAVLDSYFTDYTIGDVVTNENGIS